MNPTQAWFDYLAWANPVEHDDTAWFGTATLKSESDILVDEEADFTKLDLDAIPKTNLTGYPTPFDEDVAGRWYRRLAPLGRIMAKSQCLFFGLDRYTVAWLQRPRRFMLIVKSVQWRTVRKKGRLNWV